MTNLKPITGTRGRKQYTAKEFDNLINAQNYDINRNDLIIGKTRTYDDIVKPIISNNSSTPSNSFNVEKRDVDVRNNYAQKQAALKVTQTSTQLFGDINPALCNISSAILGKASSSQSVPAPLPALSMSSAIRAQNTAEVQKAAKIAEADKQAETLYTVDTNKYRTAADESVIAADPADWKDTEKKYNGADANLRTQKAMGNAQMQAKAQAEYDSIAQKYNTEKPLHEAAIQAKADTENAVTLQALENSAKTDKDYYSLVAQGKATNAKYFIDLSEAFAKGYEGSSFKKCQYINAMTTNEKNTYAYLLAKDNEAAKQYYKTLTTALNYRVQTKNKKGIADVSNETPAAGVVLQVAGNFVSPLSLVGAGVQTVKNQISGEEKPIDTNSAWYQGSQLKQAATEGVERHVTSTLGKAAIDFGLSAADFASALPFGEVGAVALMSSQAGGETAYNVAQRGGTAEQALGAGVISAGVQLVLNKMTVGNLKNIVNATDAGTVKGILKLTAANMGKQAELQGIQGVVTSYADNISDELIMENKSKMKAYMHDLEAMGMSEEQAYRKAITQYYVVEPAKAAGSGALQGAIFGAGATAAGKLKENSYNKKVDSYDAQLGEELRGRWGEDYSDAVVELAAVGKKLGESRPEAPEGINSNKAQFQNETYLKTPQEVAQSAVNASKWSTQASKNCDSAKSSQEIMQQYSDFRNAQKAKDLRIEFEKPKPVDHTGDWDYTEGIKTTEGAGNAGKIADGDNITGITYKHNPSNNPKVLADAVEDSKAVYGYRPNTEGSLKAFADGDWSNPDYVKKARQKRINYHEKNEAGILELITSMRNQGYSDEQIVRAVVDLRNQSRLSSYLDAKGNIIDHDGYAQALAHCKTYEQLRAEGKTNENIIKSATRGNPGMDASTGLYDDYYDQYSGEK
jgi:hypothetical protein